MSLFGSLAPIFALEGEWGDWRAIAVVFIAVIALIGSMYVLLATNFGWRVGYLVLMVALSGWTLLFAAIWLVGVPGTQPGTGPRTHEPKWVPFLAESEQGREFTREISIFPEGWDEPGKVYPGNVDSKGQVDLAKTALQEALAALAEGRKLEATKADDWNFRLAGSEPLPGQEEVPEARVAFSQKGTPLLFGVTIPATDTHREITVFAYRDKGKTYLDALYFFIAGLVGFVFHLWLLGRRELKQREREAAAAGGVLS